MSQDIVHGHDSTLIDPAHCGSSVSYRVYENYNNLYGEVILADCNHKINWQFSNTGEDYGDVEKVDAAIEALMGFRRTWNKAKRDYERAKKAAASVKKA